MCKVIDWLKRLKSIGLEMLIVLAFASWFLFLGFSWAHAVLIGSFLSFSIKMARHPYTQSDGKGGTRHNFQTDDQKIEKWDRIIHDYVQPASVCAFLTAPHWLAWLFTSFLAHPWF